MEESLLDLSENDIVFEEELLRHEYSLSVWWKYINFKRSNKNASQYSVNMVYERALRCVPYSYKLWNEYIRMRRTRVLTKRITDPEYNDCNDIYERCLVHMNKMPRVYIEFVKFLMLQRKFAYAVSIIDRSLNELPLTQHYRVWPLYIFLVKQVRSELLTRNVFERYLKIYPDKINECLDFLAENNFSEYLINILLSVLNHEQKQQQKSRYHLLNLLVESLSKYASPTTCSLHHIDLILKVADSFTDGLGQVYCYLADYFIRIGQNEAARDVLMTALKKKIRTVKDFGIVFDTLVGMDELLINRLMQNSGDGRQLEFRLARLEHLIEQRPILLSDVLLRQNPHNADEWLKRVDLYTEFGNIKSVVETFEAAILIFEESKNDDVFKVFVGYLNFCEKNFSFEQTMSVWEKVLAYEHFKNADRLAELYCRHVEFLLLKKNNNKNNNKNVCIGLLQSVLHKYSKYRHVNYYDFGVPAKHRLFKNLNLWCLLIDLTDNHSKGEARNKLVRQEADHVISLQIANPQFILNYARFLMEQNCFEEAFRAYEAGVGMFQFPHVYDIYSTYLFNFVSRYNGSKLHRTRMLLDQAIQQCKAQKSSSTDQKKRLYMFYAWLEERYGFYSRMDRIYEEAIDAVSRDEKKSMYIRYINSAIKVRGFINARGIFNKAIQVLPVNDALLLGMKYVQLELSINEVARCRSIFNYLSQIADPRVAKQFWQEYSQFEMQHGDKETFREMLRIKRTITAHYNVEVDIQKVREYKKALENL